MGILSYLDEGSDKDVGDDTDFQGPIRSKKFEKIHGNFGPNFDSDGGFYIKPQLINIWYLLGLGQRNSMIDIQFLLELDQRVHARLMGILGQRNSMTDIQFLLELDQRVQVHGELDTKNGAPSYLSAMIRHFYPDRKSRGAAEFTWGILNFQKDQDIRLKVGYEVFDKMRSSSSKCNESFFPLHIHVGGVVNFCGVPGVPWGQSRNSRSIKIRRRFKIGDVKGNAELRV
ncbi:hypothetical protein LOK49_LG07G01056 [Camellia lanceoleosa]|uniref:Uncharacterized protein n=1 Tax=Camellia lanceoleosa TaxID=1840588 RepID=A0ACC0H6V6_9ERIC|nr:hypothetical protein LOK49_LG07G01056 [Camellia lanceoleosa]